MFFFNWKLRLLLLLQSLWRLYNRSFNFRDRLILFYIFYFLFRLGLWCFLWSRVGLNAFILWLGSFILWFLGLWLLFLRFSCRYYLDFILFFLFFLENLLWLNFFLFNCWFRFWLFLYFYIFFFFFLWFLHLLFWLLKFISFLFLFDPKSRLFFLFVLVFLCFFLGWSLR